MTEAEMVQRDVWPLAQNGDFMRFALANFSSRKLRLYSVAQCRMIWADFTDPLCQEAIEVAEAISDEQLKNEQRRSLADRLYEFANHLNQHGPNGDQWSFHLPYFATADDINPSLVPQGVRWAIAMAAASVLNEDPKHTIWASHRITNVLRMTSREHLYHQRQRSLAPEIFGINPMQTLAFAPEWRTSTAVAIAQGMYESRDFSAMPILADALQDVGCDHDDVLNHCRDPQQVHVRGCWVVDGVLGKS